MSLSNPLLLQSENPLLFLTATILKWQHLLKPDKYKNIIISSFKYLVNAKRVRISGFVIMPNHFHLIFLPINDHLSKDIQRDLLKFTAQQIKFDLLKNHPSVLERFKSTQKDRKYQIWERRPLSVPLLQEKSIEQKLIYIHRNPIVNKWNLVVNEEEYLYSSAEFYARGIDRFGFLSHYKEVF